MRMQGMHDLIDIRLHLLTDQQPNSTSMKLHQISQVTYALDKRKEVRAHRRFHDRERHFVERVHVLHLRITILIHDQGQSLTPLSDAID